MNFSTFYDYLLREKRNLKKDRKVIKLSHKSHMFYS